MPNFTTCNLDYLKKHGQELVDLVGRIAYSVDFEEEIDAFIKYHSENAEKKGKNAWQSSIGVQHVVGSVSQDKLCLVAAHEALHERRRGLERVRIEHGA